MIEPGRGIYPGARHLTRPLEQEHVSISGLFTLVTASGFLDVDCNFFDIDCRFVFTLAGLQIYSHDFTAVTASLQSTS